MIAIQEAGFGRPISRLPFPEARHERAVVIFSLDKEMDDVAVSVNPAHDQLAVVVRQRRRLHETFAATLRRFIPRRGRVLDFQRYCLHAITMFGNVIGNRIIRTHWSR